MNTSILVYKCTIGDIDNAPSPDPAELIPIAAALRLVNLHIYTYTFNFLEDKYNIAIETWSYHCGITEATDYFIE